jgi:hypothetical protein
LRLNGDVTADIAFPDKIGSVMVIAACCQKRTLQNKANPGKVANYFILGLLQPLLFWYNVRSAYATPRMLTGTPNDIQFWRTYRLFQFHCLGRL